MKSCRDEASIYVRATARRAQKEKYRGELFIADWDADPAGTRFLEFFQIDKATGEPKGIVAIDLVEELK